LGLTSFGGPIAHLGYFHREFVQRRAWLDDAAYADLVALCQFLPGPASSQVAFALGMRRAGIAGAVAASLCFTLPSAIVMIALGYSLGGSRDLGTAGWVHGLKLAAVAVVAQAVWTMGRKLCPDAARIVLALVAAAAAALLPHAGMQVALIAVGGLVGWAMYRNGPLPGIGAAEPGGGNNHRVGAAALLVFGLLLVALPLASRQTGDRNIAVFDSFYRSGALVFGGGHVVLPLLRAEVVPPPHAWMSDDAFLAGYGAAQAVPGPLSSFAGYLGAVIYRGPQAWTTIAGGMWCLLGIFLPAWLLIGGALPFWHTLRSKAWAQAGLRGANAAVVGVLLAALYSPVGTAGIRGAWDLVAAVAALVLLFLRVPPLVVVLMAAGAGSWLLPGG
jgi:chromate transporter